MGFAYAAISIFITLFYSRQITNVICFGRRRDRGIVKSKKAYYAIYTCVYLFFLTLCLMMGSAAGVDDTFDHVLYFWDLKSGTREYVTVDSVYDEKDYKHAGDFTLIYYIEKNTDVVETEQLVRKILEENNMIYKRYQLQGYELRGNNGKNYWIYFNGQVFAQIEIEKKLFFKEIQYHWIREKLNGNIGEG